MSNESFGTSFANLIGGTSILGGKLHSSPTRWISLSTRESSLSSLMAHNMPNGVTTFTIKFGIECFRKADIACFDSGISKWWKTSTVLLNASQLSYARDRSPHPARLCADAQEARRPPHKGEVNAKPHSGSRDPSHMRLACRETEARDAGFQKSGVFAVGT